MCVVAHYHESSQDPTPEPPPEQTASILSMVLYTFLDPIVFTAYKMPHLPFDLLPPLADYDRAKSLVKRGFPVCTNDCNSDCEFLIVIQASGHILGR